ncbi:TPA: metal ABC transporter permease, partial [Mannheimia haemolytica]|nr:metal ABC transporter permease [Mannheimia haemolytica]
SATARRFAKTPEKMVLIAIFFSIIAVSGGLLLSSWKDTPAGPSVVICAGLIFLLSLFKKEYH